jgi:hypothetical protein
MVEAFKKQWHALKESRPGCRFQDRYQRHQQSRLGRSKFGKVLFFGGGPLLMLVGILLLFIPGPGLVFLFVGAGMLASESLVTARFLDRVEIQLRRLNQKGKALWENTPGGVKALVVAVLAGGIVAAAYVGYRLFFGG